MSRALEPISFGPLTRHMLALYCGASGDHNPLHTDINFARERGRLDDVIGHGMLSMALAGRLVSAAATPRAQASFAVRFLGKSRIGDTLIGSGSVADAAPGAVSVITLRVDTTDGRAILCGTATLRPAPHDIAGEKP